MAFVDTPSGVHLWFESAGGGEPLVLVHGWGMSRTVWRYQQGLATDHRVIAVDLRGHGRSSAPSSGYDFDDFANDLLVLFDHLRLNNVTLLGWSMGAMVALTVCSRLRERLAALVLVSGTPKFTAADDYPFGLPAAAAKGLALRLKKDYPRAMADFYQGMFAEGELSPEEFRRIKDEVAIARELPGQETARESLASLAAADLRHLLPAIDLPVLLVHGSADAICLPEASRHMAEQLPNARLVILEGVGHAPFLSRPTEFTAVLTKFLDGIHT
ncbi:MAG TPA: alpha/beta fold hydrolase [Geobacteraceae bacterium]